MNFFRPLKMRKQNPLSLASLSTAGLSIVASVVAGFALGWVAWKYLHWDLAVPIGILLGFGAGMFSMIRQLSRL